MDKNTYLLKISGSIVSEKHKEFEQTIRFVFNMLPSGCFASHLAIDVLHPNLYHVLTLWRSGEQLASFNSSDEFNLIKGSFQTLGFVNKSIAAKVANVNVFRIESDDL